MKDPVRLPNYVIEKDLYVEHLKVIASDPMWADHSEISKKSLAATIRIIETMGAEIDLLRKILAETYQFVGVLLDDTGQFDTEHGQKILDNLSRCAMVHADVLPWPSSERATKALDNCTKTAPERIYLIVNPEAFTDENGVTDGSDLPFSRSGSDDEIGWCEASQGGLEVEYVRADIAAARGQ